MSTCSRTEDCARDVGRDEQATAAARSILYELCVRALAWPTQAHLDRLVELSETLAGVESDVDEVNTSLAQLLAVVASGYDVDELRRSHAALFTQIDSQDCPPYETAFNAGDVFRQTAVMADVAGFYRAHGLRVGGTERERPDHIQVELEFMAFMSRKEAWALEHLGPEEIAECRRTQAGFLRDHLGCWGPAFGRRAAVLATHPLHKAAGHLVSAWLLADMAFAEVVPESRYDEPLPLPDPETGECGLECAPSESESRVPVELRKGGS